MGVYRSRKTRIFGGVCGGIAEAMDWDPSIVRILYVALSICSTTFPGILVYVVLWLVMPEEDEAPSSAG